MAVKKITSQVTFQTKKGQQLVMVMVSIRTVKDSPRILRT